MHPVGPAVTYLIFCAAAFSSLTAAQQYYPQQQQQQPQYQRNYQSQQQPQQYGQTQYPQYQQNQQHTTTTQSYGSATSTPSHAQGTGTEASSAACTSQLQQRLNSCANELMRMGVFSQASMQIEQLTLNDLRRRQRDYFVQLCSAYNQFNQCLGGQAAKQACYVQEPFKARFAVADAALDYVCGDGHSSMLVNWDCYLTAAARPDVTECESRIATNTLSSQQSISEFSQGSSACSALQTYIDCIRAPIETTCGKESFDTVVQAIERPVHVYLPYCTLAAGSILPSLLLLAISIFATYMY